MKTHLPFTQLIFVSLAFCGVSWGIWLFINFFILTRLGDWTMHTSMKYLLIEFNPFDFWLFLLFPLLTVLRNIFLKNFFISDLVKAVLLIFMCVLMSLFVGLLFALYTWNTLSYNPLLPHFIREQPNSYYWTIFIALGVFIPLFGQVFFQKTKINGVKKIQLD